MIDIIHQQQDLYQNNLFYLKSQSKKTTDFTADSSSELISVIITNLHIHLLISKKKPIKLL